MNISVQAGPRSTQTLITETRQDRDVEDALQQLEPNEGPLTTILSMLGAESAHNSKIEWFEDQLLPDFDVLAGGAGGVGVALAVGDATMTVTNYAYYRYGDLVRINDNEIVRVTATPTTTTVSIKRGYGSIPATAAPVGSRLWIVSDAAAEFDSYRDQLTTQKVPKYNYTQTLKTPISFTGSELGTQTFAGVDLDQERAKAMIEHKKKMEKSLIVGQPYLDNSGSEPVRTQAGIVYYIQTNVKDVSGGFTEAEFEDFIRICFRYGSPEKTILCSPKAIQSINGFQRSKLQTFSDDSTYGVTMSEYKNAGRRVMLVEEKLLTNQNLNDLTGIAGWAILVDFQYLKLKYLKGRATELWENVQNPGVDGEIDEYRTEYGTIVPLDQVHGLLTGVQD